MYKNLGLEKYRFQFHHNHISHRLQIFSAVTKTETKSDARKAEIRNDAGESDDDDDELFKIRFIKILFQCNKTVL